MQVKEILDAMSQEEKETILQELMRHLETEDGELDRDNGIDEPTFVECFCTVIDPILDHAIRKAEVLRETREKSKEMGHATLDIAVHDHFRRLANDINNQGAGAQVRTLIVEAGHKAEEIMALAEE